MPSPDAGRKPGKTNTIQATCGVSASDPIFNDGIDWKEFNRRIDKWLKERGIDHTASGSFVFTEDDRNLPSSRES